VRRLPTRRRPSRPLPRRSPTAPPRRPPPRALPRQARPRPRPHRSLRRRQPPPRLRAHLRPQPAAPPARCLRLRRRRCRLRRARRPGRLPRLPRLPRPRRPRLRRPLPRLALRVRRPPAPASDAAAAAGVDVPAVASSSASRSDPKDRAGPDSMERLSAWTTARLPARRCIAMKPAGPIPRGSARTPDPMEPRTVRSGGSTSDAAPISGVARPGTARLRQAPQLLLVVEPCELDPFRHRRTRRSPCAYVDAGARTARSTGGSGPTIGHPRMPDRATGAARGRASTRWAGAHLERGTAPTPRKPERLT
jgi:hypothetical protein